MYELCNMKGKVIKKKVNANRLKPYIRRSTALDKKYDNKEVMDSDCEDEVIIESESANEDEDEKYELPTNNGRKKKPICMMSPPPKKQCGKVVTRLDRLVPEILCGDELTDDHMTVASKLLKSSLLLVACNLHY